MSHIALLLSVPVLLVGLGSFQEELKGQAESRSTAVAPEELEERPQPKDPDRDSQGRISCVSHRVEAKAIIGFDHLVHLKSACKKPVTCQVSTDVNPEKQQVSLAPGEEKSVVTFRGSPARVFKASVECTSP